MIDQLAVQLAGVWRTTSWVEILAVALAIAYLLLAIRQSLSCWAAAFVAMTGSLELFEIGRFRAT